MLSLSDIKTGKNIMLHDEPYVVLHHEHSKTGRAGAVLRTKLKSLKTGTTLEKTFQGADKVDEAEISKSEAQFLYRDGDDYYFMDTASYDQFFLPQEVLKETTNYLVEETLVAILNFNEEPINIELPIKMELRVVEAPPGIKGDTATSGSKIIKLETGMEVSAPLFIKEDDVVLINTQTGQYVSRV